MRLGIPVLEHAKYLHWYFWQILYFIMQYLFTYTVNLTDFSIKNKNKYTKNTIVNIV